MSLSEKSYNLNEAAFIDKNKNDKIIYCPFCGASSIYFSEEGETYNIKPEELKDNVRIILEHAMKLEIFNGDFYNRAAKQCKSEKIKNMFEALSYIEFTHAKIHKRLGSFKEEVSLVELNYSKYDTDEKLLKAASLREEHAVSYYNKYSKEVENSIISKVFKALSDVEKGHIKLTLNEI